MDHCHVQNTFYASAIVTKKSEFKKGKEKSEGGVGGRDTPLKNF